jgi:hypothetical protein
LPHLTSCGRLTLHVDGGIKKPGCRMRVRRREGDAILDADLSAGREYLVAPVGFRLEDLSRRDFAL